MKQADWFEGRSVLDPRKVVYLGSEAGYDRFRFKGKGITPSKVSVIMPAKFNETPNIGNPVVGWNGPTYGFIIEASGI
ncbi:MAG: hypothetical protein NTV34_04665 [Proteobacteria bacterium]|nr:hypothetical protein [Pseudomonadota bacterium]